MASAEVPLVSIVTPSYNMAAFLAETIESVRAQEYPRIEHIVVDGGSTDESLQLLSQYSKCLSYTSGPDDGPSDAIHRGLRQANGEIFGWLNADDTLLPGAVGTAVEYLRAHPEIDVVYGEAWWIDEAGARLGRYPSLPFDPTTLQRDCFICQPAAFIRASAYRRCQLDPTVNWSFDYDLWIRMTKAGFRFAFLPQYLANSRIHRGSKTIYEREKVFRYSMDLLKRHYGYIPLTWVYGHKAFECDGRDQFFEPLRLTPGLYFAALPAGLRLNTIRSAGRFFWEWATTPLKGAWRMLADAFADTKLL
jgi:glycosyltransferase involved in cell wall biosynthesis